MKRIPVSKLIVVGSSMYRVISSLTRLQLQCDGGAHEALQRPVLRGFKKQRN